MEAPTPVSALLHAATLVTAGVYLLLRSSPILEYSPTALLILTFIGSTTAFVAASSGLVQNDLKRIVAFSTISQLGYYYKNKNYLYLVKYPRTEVLYSSTTLVIYFYIYLFLFVLFRLPLLYNSNFDDIEIIYNFIPTLIVFDLTNNQNLIKKELNKINKDRFLISFSATYRKDSEFNNISISDESIVPLGKTNNENEENSKNFPPLDKEGFIKYLDKYIMSVRSTNIR